LKESTFRYPVKILALVPADETHGLGLLPALRLSVVFAPLR
jgi:hypothetical protein